MAFPKLFDYSNLHSSSPDIIFVNIDKLSRNYPECLWQDN